MWYKCLQLGLISIVVAKPTTHFQVDELTPEEVEILGSINSKVTNNSLTSNFQTPECNCENLTCVCCLKFSLAKLERELCLDAGFNKDDMKANVQLTFNREEIFTYSLRVTKVCANLPPPLSKVEICIHAYKVDVKDMPHSGMFCMKAELSLYIPFLSIDFNCVNWEQKHLSLIPLDNGKEAPTVNVNVKQGHLELVLNSVIPKELLQQIRDLSQRIATVVSQKDEKYAKLVKKQPDEYSSEAYKWNLFTNIWKKSLLL